MIKKIPLSALIYLLILLVIVILRLLLSLFPSEQIASQMVNLTDNFRLERYGWWVGWEFSWHPGLVSLKCGSQISQILNACLFHFSSGWVLHPEYPI